MTKVYIEMEDVKRYFIYPYKTSEYEDDYPLALHPVEIPDELFVAHQKAEKLEQQLRQQIIETYGVSPRNTTYEKNCVAIQSVTGKTY